METWHSRLDRAINARNETWDKIVKITGLAKPSVYAWKPNATKRSGMMNGDNAARVCAYLSISPLWLFYGEGQSGLELAARDTTAPYNVQPFPPCNSTNTDEAELLEAFREADDTAKAMLLAQARTIIAAKKRAAHAS